MATPANITLRLIPQLPDWKKEALSKVEYGPIMVASVFLKRSIPWKRWWGMLCTDVVFAGISDSTYDLEADKNEDNPIIYNFFISIPPDEKEEISAILEKTDEEIVSLVLTDFKRIVARDDIEEYVIGSEVNRWPIGELELSPEYYLDLLPHLPKPVNNIHFCGDYTDGRSFLAGAVFSGFRVARELGSQYVVAEEDEIAFPKVPKWGAFGLTTLFCTILLVVCGLYLPNSHGTILTFGGLLLLAVTAAFPFYFPPSQRIYKGLLLVALGLGGLMGLVAGVIG